MYQNLIEQQMEFLSGIIRGKKIDDDITEKEWTEIRDQEIEADSIRDAMEDSK